jgi:hypothetical protein
MSELVPEQLTLKLVRFLELILQLVFELYILLLEHMDPDSGEVLCLGG